MVKLRTHHGGYFVHHPATTYIEGRCDVDKVGWDVDEMSAIDISNYIKGFGYQEFGCVWYRYPKLDLSNGLRPLNTDVEVIQFANDVKGHEYVDIYVEHLIDTHVFEEGLASLSGDEVQVIKVNVVGGENVKERNKVDVKGRGKKDFESHLGGEKDSEGVGEGVKDGVEGDGDSDSEDECYVNHDIESESDSQADEGEDSESEDEDYDVNQDEEEDGMSDVSLDDSDYDEYWDWTTVLLPETLDPQGTHITIVVFSFLYAYYFLSILFLFCGAHIVMYHSFV